MEALNLNLEETALIVIDLQKGIVGMGGQPYDNQDVVNNNKKLAEAFREKGGFVTLVHVDFHDGGDALQPITDQPSASGQSERPDDWTDMVPELGPESTDLIVTKRNWGAFFGTDLDLQLRRRGIKNIVLSGIATNIGVETTAREAFQRNYQQVFATDAMNALTKEEHDFTVSYMFPKMGRVRSTEDILNNL
ncbi:hydrolase [Tuberibacillus sp. Marseille-P3662]|uniref:hydrolase n=1 Tax=Tuberibacillus sp. Marseille-P3662 TaxID=1965358 RepID=UPI000A1CE539|nr:hydrolase [Tuberibacillus sp. Marseille-P3662]